MAAGDTDQLTDHDLAVLAEQAARAAGAVLLDRYGHITGLQSKTSSTDPVSDADRASEALLVATLTEVRPHDSILGEEGTDRIGSTGLRWVIDPLDGTVNYLYGLPGWSVSIAAEDGDGTVVGVVHDPLTEETYIGLRGAGATLNGVTLHANTGVPLDRALVATGFAYEREHRARQARTVSRILARVRDIRRLGSAALDLCSVAAGRVDAYFEDSIAPWDGAAGALIAREAGAEVTALSGGPGNTGLLAAAGDLHAALERLLAEAAAD
jgi:myo-inositol-1(or 4)-monophosphatase